MKVGDLVCYNAGGMKSKTLGMVIEMRDDNWNGGMYPVILIQWHVVGEIMPRRDCAAPPNEEHWKHYNKKPVTGELVWYRHGNWFEVKK